MRVQVIIACLVQLASWNSCDGYSTQTIPGKVGYFHQEENFTLRCYGESTAEENLIPLFVKNNVYIVTINGSASSTDGGAFPYAVFSGGNVDSVIEDNAPGRYSSSGSHNATHYDYTYTITALKATDTGNYSCGGKKGEGGEIEVGPQMAPVTVLEPIAKMAIIYKPSGEGNTDLKNNTGLDDMDGQLTFTTENDGGELVCMVQYSTDLPKDCTMKLYDTNTNQTTDVTGKFSLGYPETSIPVNGPFMTVLDKYFFRSPAPTSGNPKLFGFEDSGKTLNFTCMSRGMYPVSSVGTVLDIQFAPLSPTCIPGDPLPMAPVGYKNFTMLCHTRANPAVTAAWTANGTALRSGVNVHNSNEGPYLVSVLTIDEIQEADFADYMFTATNTVGMKSIPEANSEWKWTLVKGDIVNEASTDAANYPWGQTPGGGGPTDGAPTDGAPALPLSLPLVVGLAVLALAR